MRTREKNKLELEIPQAISYKHHECMNEEEAKGFIRSAIQELVIKGVLDDNRQLVVDNLINTYVGADLAFAKSQEAEHQEHYRRIKELMIPAESTEIEDRIKSLEEKKAAIKIESEHLKSILVDRREPKYESTPPYAGLKRFFSNTIVFIVTLAFIGFDSSLIAPMLLTRSLVTNAQIWIPIVQAILLVGCLDLSALAAASHYRSLVYRMSSNLLPLLSCIAAFIAAGTINAVLRITSTAADPGELAFYIAAPVLSSLLLFGITYKLGTNPVLKRLDRLFKDQDRFDKSLRTELKKRTELENEMNEVKETDREYLKTHLSDISSKAYQLREVAYIEAMSILPSMTPSSDEEFFERYNAYQRYIFAPLTFEETVPSLKALQEIEE